MTAWTDAIDGQLGRLDNRVVAETAQRVYLVAQQAFATGQRASEILAAIAQLDLVLAERVVWRAILVDARALGYLPDARSRYYSEDLGGFLQ